jgi:hypothetical protein
VDISKNSKLAKERAPASAVGRIKLHFCLHNFLQVC